MNNEFVEKINNDINASNDEIIYLNGQKQLAKEQLPEDKYIEEAKNIDEHIAIEQEKIATNDEILKNYELAYYLTKNLYNLNQLYASERDFQTRDEIKEEIAAKTAELEMARASLPEEAQESLDNIINEEPVLQEEPVSTEEPISTEEPRKIQINIERNRINNIAILNDMIADYYAVAGEYENKRQEAKKQIFSRQDISAEEKQDLYDYVESSVLDHEELDQKRKRKIEIERKIRAEAMIMLNPAVFNINDRNDAKKIYDYFNQINLQPLEDEYFSNIEKQIYQEVISENELLREIISFYSNNEVEFNTNNNDYEKNAEDGSEGNPGDESENNMEDVPKNASNDTPDIEPKIDPEDLIEDLKKYFEQAEKDESLIPLRKVPEKKIRSVLEDDKSKEWVEKRRKLAKKIKDKIKNKLEDLIKRAKEELDDQKIDDCLKTLDEIENLKKTSGFSTRDNNFKGLWQEYVDICGKVKRQVPLINPEEEEALYDKIDQLFHKATYDLDVAALLEAEKLIEKISDEATKEDYSENYYLVFDHVVSEKSKQIWDLLDDAEKAFKKEDIIKCEEFLRKANDICNQLPECDDKYHAAEEIERVRKLGNINLEPEKEPETIEGKYEKIEKLLLEATYNVTYEPLIEAEKLISSLPDDNVKKEYIKMYERTYAYVTQAKIDKITQLLKAAEEAYNSKDIENYKKSLDEGVAIINTLPESDKKKDLQAEAERIGSLAKDDKDIPTDIQKKPGKSLKTLAAVLAGIGIGVAVAFYTNPLGILIMNVVGVLAKVGLNSARRKAIAKGFKTSKDVLEAEPPREGLAGKIDKLKAYLKSEEGIRDMIWMVNAAMISGNVFSILQQFGIMPRNISPTSQIAGTQAPTQTTPAPAEASINDTYSNMPNQVYDSAAQAQSGMGAEMPIRGAFENFEIGRVFTPDGRNILIDGSMTPSQFRSTYGVDIADCTLGIQNPNGVDLSWNTANSLRK